MGGRGYNDFCPYKDEYSRYCVICNAFLFYKKKFRSVIIIESEVMQNGRILLNIQEVCDYLGIGKTKARELLRGYNGFGVQIGNRWYANKKKLDEWIDNETM